MNPTRKQLIRIIGLLPVVFFAYVTVHYSVNAPWFDDFDPFPDFLRKWILSDTLTEKIGFLLQPNNEHRMVIGKGVMILYYALTGKLDFTFLHIAGILFTFGTLFLVRRAFLSARLPLYLFLPVPFLLFQLQYYLISLWAICGLQHQPVVFFVCLAMYWLARREGGPVRLGLAILAGFCANFAMSNGIFVWVGGAAILLFQTRYRPLAIWCASGAVAIALYFSGMSAQGNESSLGFFMQNPHLSFLGFFAFLGGLFDFAPDRPIQVRTALPIVMAMGVMVWVTLWLLNILLPWLRDTFRRPAKLPVWLTRYRFRPGHETLGYFCLGVMLFLLANAAVIGLLRPRFGFYVMVVSNYKIYPALFLLISYLSFLSATDVVLRMRGFRIGMGISLLVWGLTLVHYWPTLSERRKYLLANAYNQEHNGFGLGHVPGSPAAVYIDSLMHFMTDRGIYHYPVEIDPLIEQMKLVRRPLTDSLNFRLERRPEGLAISSPKVEIPGGYNTGAYVFLRKEEQLYLFKLNQRLYTGRNILIRYDEGVEVMIPYEAIPAGTYEWGVLIRGHSDVDSGLAGTVTLL
jgi:hypothetical protein